MLDVFEEIASGETGKDICSPGLLLDELGLPGRG